MRAHRRGRSEKQLLKRPEKGAAESGDGVGCEGELAYRIRGHALSGVDFELEDLGVRFAGETIDSGVCHLAPFADPEGNALMLHHRYAPQD